MMDDLLARFRSVGVYEPTPSEMLRRSRSRSPPPRRMRNQSPGDPDDLLRAAKSHRRELKRTLKRLSKVEKTAERLVSGLDSGARVDSLKIRSARLRRRINRYSLGSVDVWNPMLQLVGAVDAKLAAAEIAASAAASAAAFAASVAAAAAAASAAVAEESEESAPSGDEKNVWAQRAAELKRRGIVVVPVLTPRERAGFYSSLLSEMKRFPEYTAEGHKHGIYVLGGFGAFGNPAAFHNPTVRAIRRKMMFSAVPLFREFDRIGSSADQPPRYLEQIIDRVGWRRKSTSPSAEAWHHDVTPGLLPRETVFGGWINLDPEPRVQGFSCVPETQSDTQPDVVGFGPIRDATELRACKSGRTLIRIPPGHWVVFYQNIAHEVVSKTLPYSSLRLFMGWRLTPSPEPLFSATNLRRVFGKLPTTTDEKQFVEDRSIGTVLARQGVPLLPSFQEPPMYAVLHWTCWFHRATKPTGDMSVRKWAMVTFIDRAKHDRLRKSEEKTYHVVRRHMTSLEEMGLPLYPEYTTDEASLLKPARRWTVVDPSTGRAHTLSM